MGRRRRTHGTCLKVGAFRDAVVRRGRHQSAFSGIALLGGAWPHRGSGGALRTSRLRGGEGSLQPRPRDRCRRRPWQGVAVLQMKRPPDGGLFHADPHGSSTCELSHWGQYTRLAGGVNPLRAPRWSTPRATGSHPPGAAVLVGRPVVVPTHACSEVIVPQVGARQMAGRSCALPSMVPRASIERAALRRRWFFGP